MLYHECDYSLAILFATAENPFFKAMVIASKETSSSAIDRTIGPILRRVAGFAAISEKQRYMASSSPGRNSQPDLFGTTRSSILPTLDEATGIPQLNASPITAGDASLHDAKNKHSAVL